MPPPKPKSTFNRTPWKRERVHKYCGVPIGNPAIFYSNLARVTKLVAEGVALGLSVAEMSAKYHIPDNHIKACLARHSLRQMAKEKMDGVVEAVVKTKLPMLQEIAGLTLATVREFFQDLASNPEKKAALTIDDIKKLADVAKNVNELTRLEEGKSTQNIHQSHEVQFKIEKDVTVLLNDLKKQDPFMDYPAISHDERESIAVEPQAAEPEGSRPSGLEPVCADGNGPAPSSEVG